MKQMTYNTDNLRVTEGHKALAAYIKRETGKVVKPESVALVLTLQVEFRKDPEQVAARQAVKEAAQQRRLEALQKHLDKARELAEKAGISVEEVPRSIVAAAAWIEPSVQDVEDASGPLLGGERVTEPAEVVGTVTPISAGRQAAKANTFGADTSAIDTVEQADEWAVEQTTEEDDF